MPAVQENGDKFPPNKEISQHVGSFGKDAMPFVQTIREKAEQAGGKLIVEEGSEINQREVLNSVHDYLLSTLHLEKLDYVDTSAEGVAADIKKSTSPGAPLIMYHFAQEDQ
jgi:hypothetical protein